jgi:hypothetical protein
VLYHYTTTNILYERTGIWIQTISFEGKCAFLITLYAHYEHTETRTPNKGLEDLCDIHFTICPYGSTENWTPVVRISVGKSTINLYFQIQEQGIEPWFTVYKTAELPLFYSCVTMHPRVALGSRDRQSWIRSAGIMHQLNTFFTY